MKLIVFILTLPVVLPLLSSGFFPMHDDTQVGRVVEMGRALGEGQFPVRWVRDLGYGYGYPLFNFYAPLPYYVGGLGILSGLSGLDATKMMIALGMMFPAATMYFFLRRHLGGLPAIVGSLLYTYAPYHAVQLYVRGAVGELWTLGFYPLLAEGVLQKNILLGSIGLAGVILSHTLLGFATTIFVATGLCTYWIFKYFKKQFHLSPARPAGGFVICHLSLLLLGLGLSAFFWLPALLEMRFTDVAGQVSATANFRDHFVCISQLWDSVWGFGGSAPGCIDGMSFKLGKLHILLAGAGIIAARHMRLLLFGLFITLGSLVMTIQISQTVWEQLPFFAYIQYPWRFLAPAAFGLSIVGATLFVRSGPLLRIAAVVVIMWVLVINGKLFRPQYIIDRSAASYEADEELRWRVSRISDEYLPPGFNKPKSEKELPQGVVVDGGTSIVINQAYFPGWRYWVNGQEVVPTIERGLPILSVPSGKSTIVMKLTNTPVRTLGNIISLMSLFLLGGYLWQKNRQ